MLSQSRNRCCRLSIANYTRVLQSTQASQKSLTPTEVVQKLDEYIIGQSGAKKAVAIAYRNRWRRERIPQEMQNEV